MQDWAEDYSCSEIDKGEGCCLHCSNKSPGCLCFECKCTKCFWYCSPEDWNLEKGHCDKVEILKKSYGKRMQELGEKNWIIYCRKKNEKEEREIKEHEEYIKSIIEKV